MPNERKFTADNIHNVLFSTKTGKDVWKIHKLPDGKNAMLVAIKLGGRVNNVQALETSTAYYTIDDCVNFLNNDKWLEVKNRPQFSIDLGKTKGVEIDELEAASEWVGNFKG
jgi:hypothetical protein